MNKSELMSLSAEDLARTLNELLKNYDSKNKLFNALCLKKQTIDRKLTQAGYIYNSERKAYLKCDKSDYIDTDQVDLKIADDSKDTVSELVNRIAKLESRVNALESSHQHSDFRVMKFNGERVNKNYRLNLEVIELIEMIKRDYSHLNVTDVINTVLYQELNKLKQ